MKVNPKKCKHCGEDFIPRYNTTQRTCSPDCALRLIRIVNKEVAAKKARKRTRAQKEALKTLPEHLKETQADFNKFIRLRDKHLPCISCGKHHTGQYDAGHYRSVGAAPELRFVETNVHKQCSPCNNHKSGNAIEYRINLVKKIGAEKVERLEGPHKAKHYKIHDAKRIKLKYRRKWRALA